MQNNTQDGNDMILELIKTHEPLLRHIIKLNVYNQVDADDVFQETVLAIIDHFRKGKPVEHPKAWLIKIAKSKCTDFHRRDKKEANSAVDFAHFISYAAFGGGVSIADEQHQEVVAEEIRNVIAGMKPIYRDVGELYIQGYSTREISGLLEIPKGTVISRARRFRQIIREYLQRDTPVPEQKTS